MMTIDEEDEHDGITRDVTLLLTAIPIGEYFSL
jgi:hypothetical protein